METKRGLLTQGNSKLSPGVWHFDVPPVTTCPGRSDLCVDRCYARRNQFLYPQVQERLAWNYAQSKRPDFAKRMTEELYRKGVTLMRWHVAGDVYSPGYGRKMWEVMGKSQHCAFWLYSRSWRIKSLYPVLAAMCGLKNCKVYLSADSETGYPPEVPEDARVAWMATEPDDACEDADLVFLDHPLRKLSLPMANVCPVETEAGKKRGTTCATCRVCFT